LNEKLKILINFPQKKKEEGEKKKIQNFGGKLSEESEKKKKG
jgi:hypothetical protein